MLEKEIEVLRRTIGAKISQARAEASKEADEASKEAADRFCCLDTPKNMQSTKTRRLVTKRHESGFSSLLAGFSTSPRYFGTNCSAQHLNFLLQHLNLRPQFNASVPRLLPPVLDLSSPQDQSANYHSDNSLKLCMLATPAQEGLSACLEQWF